MTHQSTSRLMSRLHDSWVDSTIIKTEMVPYYLNGDALMGIESHHPPALMKNRGMRDSTKAKVFQKHMKKKDWKNDIMNT